MLLSLITTPEGLAHRHTACHVLLHMHCYLVGFSQIGGAVRV